MRAEGRCELGYSVATYFALMETARSQRTMRAHSAELSRDHRTESARGSIREVCFRDKQPGGGLAHCCDHHVCLQMGGASAPQLSQTSKNASSTRLVVIIESIISRYAGVI